MLKSGKNMSQDRRLVAIMFTDIVGYSKLMAEDEKQTLAILDQNRTIHQSAANNHHGNILKYNGDGTLLSFQTSTDAVACASEIQNMLASGHDYEVRIGIHEGEAVFTENDVLGDGVKRSQITTPKSKPS